MNLKELLSRMPLGWLYMILNNNIIQVSNIRLIRYQNDQLKPMIDSKIGFTQHWIIYWKVFFYTYCCIGSIRFLALSYVLANQIDLNEDLLGYDPFIRTVVDSFNFDYKMALVFAPTPMMALYLDYLYYYKLTLYVLGHSKDMFLDNLANFFKLNPKLKNVQQIWSCPDAKFATDQLGMFPNVSKNVRAKSVVVCLVSDYVVQAGLAVSGAISSSAISLFVLWVSFEQNSSILYTLLHLGDAFLMMFYLYWNSIRLMFFIDLVGFNIAFVYMRHLRELKARFEGVLSNCELKRKNIFTYFSRIGEAFKHYQSENIKALNTEIFLNRNIVSTGMLVVVSCNFVFSIYMLTLLLYEKLVFYEKVMYLITIFLHFSIIIPNARVMINFANALYHLDRSLFRCQSILSWQSIDPKQRFMFVHFLLKSKLKLMNHYELVHTTTKFRFTIGSLVRISKQTTVMFFIQYTSFMMYSFKLIRKNGLRKLNIEVTASVDGSP